MAQQSLILSITFWNSPNENRSNADAVFANLAFVIFILYCVFAVILVKFRDDIILESDEKSIESRKSGISSVGSMSRKSVISSADSTSEV